MGPEIPEGATVQVRFAGTWYDARVLGWSMEDESWWARVRWTPPSGNRLLGTVPDRDVRRHEEPSESPSSEGRDSMIDAHRG